MVLFTASSLFHQEEQTDVYDANKDKVKESIKHRDEITDTQMRKQRRHLANKTDHILINISLEIGITYPLTSILPISGHALSLS